MIAHTPGPWIVEDDKRGRTLMVIAERGGMLGLIVNDIGRPATLLDRANARLIAAAPELLEACRRLDAWLREESHEAQYEVHALVGDAIAKAVGK